MNIIEDWREKIKAFREAFMRVEKDWSIALLFLSASAASFGLGYLTKLERSVPPVTISAAASSSLRLVSPAPASVEAGEDRIMASKNGTKFYYPWCGGGKNIKEENRIYFASAAAALAAGYAKAANCSVAP